MEPSKRMRPKKAYSLEKAVDYMSINYGIRIDRDDLLDYLRDGVLVSSVYLTGNNKCISSIDREDIPANSVTIEPYGCNFKIDKDLAEVDHFLDEQTHVHYKSKNIFLTLFYYHKVDDVFLGEISKVFNGSEMGNFWLGGYFKIPSHSFTDIINREMIYFPMTLSVNSDENNLEIFIDNHYEAKLPIHQICILHEDLMMFLASMGVIDDTYKIPEEISKLKAKISELENEKSSAKLSTKTKNTMARLIVNLIDLQYGCKNQTDIIKAFKKKGEDNMKEDGEIVQDFTKNGLIPPSSKFIRGILGDLEEK